MTNCCHIRGIKHLTLNKTLNKMLDVLLLENQHLDTNCLSTVDYFPITANPAVFYSVLNMTSHIMVVSLSYGLISKDVMNYASKTIFLMVYIMKVVQTLAVKANHNSCFYSENCSMNRHDFTKRHCNSVWSSESPSIVTFSTLKKTTRLLFAKKHLPG